MCNCKVKEFANHKNQTLFKVPWGTKLVHLDNCLIDEIIILWEAGIVTTGNCCGHNIEKPFISTIPEHADKMLALGYQVYPHPDLARRDHFWPKTIL